MKLLITGGNGQVGSELKRLCADKNWDVYFPTRDELDLSQTASIQQACRDFAPDLIVNAGAYTAVDKAESEKDLAFAINAHALETLGHYAQSQEIPIIHISTDYVFDGTKTDGRYHPGDQTNPINVYGASKLAGEQALTSACSKHLILRTAWVFSAFGNNFVKAMLNLGKNRDELGIVADQVGGPTSAKAIAKACLKLADLYEADQTLRWGTYHFSGRDKASWYDFAKAIFETATKMGYETAPRVNPIPTSDYPTPAKRPLYSVLDCSELEENFQIQQPLWKDDMAEVVQQLLKGSS